MFGTLTDLQVPQAERLLQVVSDGIRSRKPDVDETAAELVVFEVTRDTLNYGGLEVFSQYTNTTSRRSESGIFDPNARAVDDYLTARQKLILGLSATAGAGPRGHFAKCDY